MKNFKDFKIKKERGITPKEAVESILDTLDSEDIVIIITLSKENDFRMNYSLENSIQALGLLEIAKQEILFGMEVE